MSFSDLFPRDVEEHEPPPATEAHERPEWLGPPEGELGVAVPLGLVLARSEHGVVAVSHALAYSTGLSLQIVARVGGLEPRRVRRFFHEHHGPFDGEDELPDGFLRFGVELPDGRRVSNLGGRRSYFKPDDAPSAPVLLEHGGGGGQSSGTSVSWSPAFWLWPLPRGGALRLYCEWPVAGIGLTETEVAGDPLVEAASRSTPLWEEERGGPWARTSSSSSFQYVTMQRTEGAEDEEEAETVAVPAAELRAARDALRTALQALQRLAR